MNEWVSDIRLYMLNIGALAISMSDIEMILKISLLVLSIGYTVNKWFLLKNKKENEKD